jgi:hypothetical protein
MSQYVLPLDPSSGKFEHIILWVLARMKQNNPNLNDDVFDSMLHDMTIDLQKKNIPSTQNHNCLHQKCTFKQANNDPSCSKNSRYGSNHVDATLYTTRNAFFLVAIGVSGL